MTTENSNTNPSPNPNPDYYSNPNSNQPPRPTVVIAKSPKSMGIGIALSFFFGPLGMFYSTITGAIVMIFVNLIVGFLTFGIGLLVTWPIDIIWTIVAINSYNNKLMQGRV